MADYISHMSRERLRFRHPALAGDDLKMRVMNALKEVEGIAGIKAGHSSVLLLLEPEADMDKIRKKFEETAPEVLQAPAKAAAPAAHGKCAKSRGACFSGRKTLLKTFLAAGLATVGFAVVGMHKAHALAGGVFTVLAADHIWERRRAL